MTNLIQTLISGLSLGSIYALIALGYTMVYGIAKMLNFAHGDVIMVGAYSGIVAVAQLGLSPWVTVIVSIVVCAVLGVVIEFCAYKPLRQAAPLSVLITAIGVSYLLQNAALLLFGSQQMAYPTLVKLGSFSVGGVQVDGITVLTVGGVAPSEETVLDGSYAIQRPFVFATRTDEALSDAAQAFFDFATSKEADEYIIKAGAVPVVH